MILERAPLWGSFASCGPDFIGSSRPGRPACGQEWLPLEARGMWSEFLVQDAGVSKIRAMKVLVLGLGDPAR